MTTPIVVGIDLGTTHTVVAWSALDASGDPQIFAIPQLVSAGEVAERALLDSVLYAPVSGEAAPDLWGDAPWVVGEHARRRGAQVPGRLVASAKSWLCHPRVDRMAPILPWGPQEDDSSLPRISPVDASARILLHVRCVWDGCFPSRPLANQDVILTVPASFDEAARELTLEAATRAGLRVRLLEEPQAAFYAYMHSAGTDGLQQVLARAGPSALVLVCDVGGGTTDLSLMRLKSDARYTGGVKITRAAVGQHLLLGGDNMDLALAHLCESRMLQAPARLDPARFGQLVLACRRAKEKLLAGEGALDEVPITVASAGAKLVGGTLRTSVRREEAERLVLDGFLPSAARDAKLQRRRTALVGFGLPYEQDTAITRHVAWFFARHAPDALAPNALLLNGGVFHARAIGARLVQVIDSWGGDPVQMLPCTDPDLAVARGAVLYGLALGGVGARIEGGAARGYYVGLDADSDGRRKAVCVVPRGAREGAVHAARGRTFALTVGRPVRFDLFASDDARHAAGQVITIDDDHYQPLPPVATRLEADAAAPAKTSEIQVGIEGELTAIGTLELACVQVTPGGGAPRRLRLAFQLRDQPQEPAASARAAARPPSLPPKGRPFEEACQAVERVFGKGRQDVAAREVKDLVRELERLLGERRSWTLQLIRALYDALWPGRAARRRSADHERIFWQLAGFCLRPGFGDPLDAERVSALARLVDEALAFPAETRTWRNFWIAWRRVAAGLAEPMHERLRDAVDPLLAPASLKLKKDKRFKLEAPDELLEMASSLERVEARRRAQLGSWILECTWTDRDPRLWAALGRLGARVPTYASVHQVIPARTAEHWLDHLLREKWEEIPTAAPAAVQLARMTGDRARDVSEAVRQQVERRLVSVNAPEEWLCTLREVVQVRDAERTAFYGEELPVGLRLVC